MPPLSCNYESIEFSLSAFDAIRFGKSYKELDGSYHAEAVSKDGHLSQLKKSVRWNEDEEVVTIPNRRDYSREERECIWNSRKDLRRMKQECFGVIQLLNLCTYFVPSGTCTRGLEELTEASKERRRWIKCAARDAVLREQAAQRRSGESRDEYRIAAAYASSSKRCQDAALRMAKMDRQDALEVYEANQDEVLSKSRSV